MYVGYFGLKQAPFSIAPDPHYLFMSERHREALAHLLYGVDGGGGFVLLSGEIGAGKTTICRCFLEQIPEHCNVAYIFNPKLTVADLLKSICHEFHLEVRHDGVGPPTIKDYFDPLNEHLLRSHAAGRNNILIIDEAQNLTPHVLEQLRLLTNLETSERKLLQIVLIGQPELRAMIARPELEQLAQRVIARYHLGALNETETRLYIQHRLGVAGLKTALPFSDEAIQRVYRLTRGVPRRINLLCDRSLLGAYATGKPQVGLAIVDKAASEVFEAPSDIAAEADHKPTRWLTRHPYATLALGALGGVLLATGLGSWYTSGARTGDRQAVGTVKSESTPSVAGVAATKASETSPDAPQAVAAAPAQPPVIPIGTPALSELLSSENVAWRELGQVWGRALTSDDPCAEAQDQELQCYRIGRMTVHGLRQLDRPGILTLREGGSTAWALLTAADQNSVTLHAGDRAWRMPLADLDGRWRGEYATLWRTPPGQQGRLSDGSKGLAGEWLQQRLKALQAAGKVPPSANTLKSRVQAFQRASGIDADGLAGPMTFMQINRATDVEEPRLARP